MCGVEHGGEAVVTDEGGGEAEAAIEGMAAVSTAALQAVVDVVEAGEETEQVEAVTDAVTDVAEEASEVAIVEELAGDAGQEEEAAGADQEGDDGEGDDEAGAVEHGETAEHEAGEGAEPEGADEEVIEHAEQPTAVSVPPQLADDEDPARRGRAPVRTNSFRRHRTHR
jgi:hypothetical protein